MTSQIVAGILALIATLLGVALTAQKSRINELNKQLSEKKAGLYLDILNFYFDFDKQRRGLIKEKEGESLRKLLEIKKNLILYSNDNIFSEFQNWFIHINKENNPRKTVMSFMKIFFLIRKDMGNNSTKVNPDDILQLIMGDENEFNKLKEITEIN